MKFPTLILSALLVLAPVCSLSATRTAADEIKQRQANFKQMGVDFKALNDIAKEKTPYSKDEALRLAADLEALSKKIPELFSPESSKGDTKAKPEIWTELGKWNSATNGFQTEVGKLSLLAKNSGLSELKNQVQSTAQSCKACHENFRSR